ncbi:hypothetical protein LBMAG52_05110 [Planctomycetia bacterium]|nr:hypothetical protein LBMAG52_05110 [Planctomycetia bacterium]
MTTALKSNWKPAKNTKSHPSATEIVPLPWHDDVATLLKIGKPPLLLLVGDPGVGKTTYARYACVQFTSSEPLLLSGSPELEQSHIWGRWTLSGQETRFVDGPLPMALKTGRWLVIEEFSQIPLECRAALLPLRDQSEITNPLTGEILPIPESFRMIATSNSESLSCRKNAGIAKVLYDGFYVLETCDLSDSQVTSLLRHNFPTASAGRVARVLYQWNEYREFTSKGSSGKSHLSYRAAEHLLRLLEHGMPEPRAVEIALINKFLPSDSDLYSAAKFKVSVSTPESDTDSECDERPLVPMPFRKGEGHETA